MPWCLRRSFISSLFAPVSSAIRSSVNPSRFASFNRLIVNSLFFNVSSVSIIFWIFWMKNGSIPVSLLISSISIPLRSAWYTANNRSWVGFLSASISSSSSQSLYPKYMSVSSERIAFWSDSSIVRPIAITSPVDFIAVVRCLSAVVNLSKGQRGIFTTV